MQVKGGLLRPRWTLPHRGCQPSERSGCGWEMSSNSNKTDNTGKAPTVCLACFEGFTCINLPKTCKSSKGRDYHHGHFTDEVPKAWRDEETASDHTAPENLKLFQQEQPGWAGRMRRVVLGCTRESPGHALGWKPTCKHYEDKINRLYTKFEGGGRLVRKEEREKNKSWISTKLPLFLLLKSVQFIAWGQNHSLRIFLFRQNARSEVHVGSDRTESTSPKEQLSGPRSEFFPFLPLRSPAQNHHSLPPAPRQARRDVGGRGNSDMLCLASHQHQRPTHCGKNHPCGGLMQGHCQARLSHSLIPNLRRSTRPSNLKPHSSSNWEYIPWQFPFLPTQERFPHKFLNYSF